MPGKEMPQIKDKDQYEALRDKGYNKQTAARIANSDEEQDDNRPNAYEDWTKDQLYEKAEELDLEGRSDMDKPELIAALRGKRYGSHDQSGS